MILHGEDYILSSQLKITNAIAIGFMTFALFLGAGNIIFPPEVGQQAGAYLVPVTIGFLMSGVGLPMLALITASRLNGGLEKFTADLPKWAGLVIGVVLYLSIGPLFAIPRTAVVSYEMSLHLFAKHSNYLLYYILVFFAICMIMAMYPGKLVDAIGKMVTPVLLIVLVLMGIATLITPAEPTSTYVQKIAESPFSFGFIEGYQTMDTLGAMVFSIVILSTLKRQGVHCATLRMKYAIIASIISALGLSLVYIMLIYLGATSHGIANSTENGAQILSAYMYAAYGYWGYLVLGSAIILACISTGVGLLSACADYFHMLLPRFSYRQILFFFTIISALVGNIGLTQLLSITMPALIVMYPVAMTLTFLSLIKSWLPHPKYVFIFAVTPVFFYSSLQAILSIKQISYHPTLISIQEVMNHLPLGESGMSWIILALIGATSGLFASNWLKNTKSTRFTPVNN